MDAAIRRDVGDLLVRAQLYKGITRAQLMAIVVNERVPNGWLEFLSNVTYAWLVRNEGKSSVHSFSSILLLSSHYILFLLCFLTTRKVRYSQGSLSAQEAAPQGSKAAAAICKDAIDKAKKDTASSQPQKDSQRKEEAAPSSAAESPPKAGEEAFPQSPQPQARDTQKQVPTSQGAETTSIRKVEKVAAPDGYHRHDKDDQAGQKKLPQANERRVDVQDMEEDEDSKSLEEDEDYQRLGAGPAYESSLWDTSDNAVAAVAAKPLFDPMAVEDSCVCVCVHFTLWRGCVDQRKDALLISLSN